MQMPFGTSCLFIRLGPPAHKNVATESQFEISVLYSRIIWLTQPPTPHYPIV